MLITFLLGNGFDIGIGMPTRYENFYKEYCQLCDEDNDNIQEFKYLIAKKNKGNVKRVVDWSDFERAFGEHSKDMNNKHDYLERFENFVEAFNLYLEKIETFVDYTDTDVIAKTMDTAVKKFYHIRPADKEAISKVIDHFGADITYNFVTFNYTRTVDKCVEIFRQLIKGDKDRRVGVVAHIHGFIDQNMIVGVNDAEQILNREFSTDEEILRELVKPLQNENSRTAYEDATLTIIRSSHIICTYGMSIGATDKKWWDEISHWLVGNPYRTLVILIHEGKYNPRFPHQQDRYIRPIIERFMSFSCLSDSQKKGIESQIYIGVNNDVFSMNLYHRQEERTSSHTDGVSDMLSLEEAYESLGATTSLMDSFLHSLK